MLKRLLLSAAFMLPGAAWAADGTLAVTPGSGATIVTSPDGSGNVVPHSIPCDHTTPTQCAAINSSGQAAIQAPPSLPLPSGAATSANQEVTAAGTSATSAQAVQGVTNGVPAPVVDSTGANFASIVTAITNAAITPVTAAAPTVSASASVTSLVLKASATISTGGVKYFHAENITSTAGYCVLYNGTTAPSTGALTAANVLGFQRLPANSYCDWSATNIPIAASSGAVVLVSSAATPFTYTTGTITAAIYGLAQ